MLRLNHAYVFVGKYLVEVSLPMKITKRKWNAILLVNCYDLSVKSSVFCQQTLYVYVHNYYVDSLLLY